jgi:hypothetical protein
MINLVQRAISGQDIDGDESIDPVKGEAGLNIAYTHGQRLAGLSLTQTGK